MGAVRGLGAQARRKFPGVVLALEAATKFYRATQVVPESTPNDEPLVVEAKVIR